MAKTTINPEFRIFADSRISSIEIYNFLNFHAKAFKTTTENLMTKLVVEFTESRVESIDFDLSNTIVAFLEVTPSRDVYNQVKAEALLRPVVTYRPFHLV